MYPYMICKKQVMQELGRETTGLFYYLILFFNKQKRKIIRCRKEGNKHSPFVPMQADEMQQRGCFSYWDLGIGRLF